MAGGYGIGQHRSRIQYTLARGVLAEYVCPRISEPCSDMWSLEVDL